MGHPWDVLKDNPVLCGFMITLKVSLYFNSRIYKKRVLN